MNFLEAVKEMKKGKKVRSEKIEKTCWLQDKKLLVHKTSSGWCETSFNVKEIEATDWVVIGIVEDKKTLSDKIHNAYSLGTRSVICTDDVKQSLKEFIKHVNQTFSDDVDIINPTLLKRAKDIFGDRLI